MIKFNNVNKIYNQNKNNEYHALKNVNLIMNDTGLVCVVGKSGSGKSTLLNLISGLDNKTNGEIIIDYQEPYCAFLFQDAQLLEQYTLKENLELAMDISNNHVDISEYIEKYDLQGLLHHKANELSSGQKMRVALIRAILENRPIIVCDEPTGALDSINSKIIAEELKEISKTRLVIVATHDRDLFFSLADQILEIEDGNIIELKESNETANKIEYSNQAILSLKNTLRFSFKNIKKFKIRYILSIISFMLSFTLLLCSLSLLLFKEGKARYNIYQSYNMPYVNYLSQMMVNEKEDYNFWPGFTVEEAQGILNENDNCFLVARNNYKVFDNLPSKTVYLNNKCDYPVLIGKNFIKDGEIIISESDAEYYASYVGKNIEDLLGEKIDGYSIVGVYKDYKEFESLDVIKLNYSNHNLFMTPNSFQDFILNSSDSLVLSLFFGDERRVLELKKNLNLQDNQIIVPESFKDETSSSFLLKSYSEKYYTKEILDYEENNCTIVDYNDTGLIIEVGETLFNKYLMVQFSINYELSINISNYSVKDIENVLSKNCEIVSDLESNIDLVKQNVIIIAAVEGGIAVLVGVLTAVLLISYLNASVNQSKREIGVLLSLGMEKKSISKIFIPDFLIVFVSSYFLAIGSSIGMFYYQLSSASKFSNFPITYGYLPVWPYLILLISVLLISIVIILFLIRKIKTKNTVDLIYEK